MRCRLASARARSANKLPTHRPTQKLISAVGLALRPRTAQLGALPKPLCVGAESNQKNLAVTGRAANDHSSLH